MQNTLKFYTQTAQDIIDGQTPPLSTCQRLAQTEDKNVFHMITGADLIREACFQKQVHLCAICNGKSGRCTEDCRFCSQSRYFDSDIDAYPILSKEKLRKGAEELMDTPVHRYSIVTSGRGLPENEVRHVADAVAGLSPEKLSYCVSLGILNAKEMKCLKQAGVTRYHHNLEASRSHFGKICTTHTYEDRVNTIKAAQKAGMSVCAGGLFGIGETMEQVLEMALDLKALDVDAVPVNFLTPINGTPLEGENHLTPLKCLKIIALMRYVLPDKEILVCGGRMLNLKKLHPLVFHAGASGIMTGNYLTTSGNQLQDDIDMIEQLGFSIRI